jgi:nitrate reductase beta subunit
VPESWLVAARASPTYRMAIDWKVAFPLHPEYRTLPMVWYVPPLSPITAAADAGRVAMANELPDIRSLRIPVRYLANLLTAGDEAPLVAGLERMAAMRVFMRARHVDGVERPEVLARVGLGVAQVEDMYRIMAIANYEDRYVIPSTHREYAESAFDLRGGCGFSFGNGCADGMEEAACSPAARRRAGPARRWRSADARAARPRPPARLPDRGNGRGAARAARRARRRARPRPGGARSAVR